MMIIIRRIQVLGACSLELGGLLEDRQSPSCVMRQPHDGCRRIDTDEDKRQVPALDYFKCPSLSHLLYKGAAPPSNTILNSD